MAEKTIGWIGQQKAAAPEKPFFIYFAPGACHGPHHVHKEWADKYKGQFDHGWDRQREITLKNQQKLGVVPKNTKLTPRPDSIPSWASRSPDEKRLYARMQEVFAGYLEHVDVQIGKVVDAIERMGLRDDTLIIFIVGDNGPSAEGSLTGTLTLDSNWPASDWRSTYFVPENLKASVARADALKPLVPAGSTLPEMALRFILNNPDVSTIIPGMRKLRNVEANLAASDKGPLPAQLHAQLRPHRWVRRPTHWSQ